MINPFAETNWKPKRAELRSFGWSLVAGLPVLAGLFWVIAFWRAHTWAVWPLWLGTLGLVAGALFVALPPVARPVYLAWYFVAACLGIVVGNVAIALVYYLVITPVGLMLRLLGKDPLRRRFDRAATSYWLEAETAADPKRYFRQF